MREVLALQLTWHTHVSAWTISHLSKPKGMMTVATKVALQMNCKMGGEPWAVKMPMKVSSGLDLCIFIPSSYVQDTMVIGYDTYHDTAQKGRSVGAIVATMTQAGLTVCTNSRSLTRRTAKLVGSAKQQMGWRVVQLQGVKTIETITARQ